MILRTRQILLPPHLLLCRIPILSVVLVLVLVLPELVLLALGRLVLLVVVVLPFPLILLAQKVLCQLH